MSRADDLFFIWSTKRKGVAELRDYAKHLEGPCPLPLANRSNRKETDHGRR